MKKFRKSMIAMLLLVCMVFTTACGSKPTETTPTPTPAGNETGEPTTNPETDPTAAPTEGPKEIVTIRYGTHYINDLDPHYQDSVTGEYTMAENKREAALAAEEAILNELGVVFEYVQFSGDTREVLLQSVMAKDPVCDIAILWGGSEGTILAQNVLQKLDDYAYIFQEDEDYSWMLYDKLFDHYYLLGSVVRFNQRWPLVYNIDLIEAVDSLKDANGNTIYPNTLFDEGKWTWSAFKDYLEKINAYYANNDAIRAYETDYRFAGLSAAYSAGGAIYGTDGLSVAGAGMKSAVSYIDELMDAGLLTVSSTYDDMTPEWTYAGNQFVFGSTVFTDIPDWFINWAATEASNREQSIGIVPWPRPDSMSLDDENYRQVITVSDSIGVPKGVSPEKTELALKALALYTKTYYTTLADVDTMAEYQDAYGMIEASSFGFDIFHDKIGDSILNSFQYITGKMATGKDYSDLLGLRVTWDNIVRDSFYGLNGSASYDVAVEANINEFNKVIEDMTSILSKEGVNDNVAPTVSFLKEPIAVPAGTKMTDAIWGEFIGATDNAEGVMTLASFKPEFNSPDTDSKVDRAYSEADFATPGYYNRAFKAYFVDQAGNKGYKTVSVYVYDPNNKTAPTVTMVAEPAAIAVNTDVATITWAGSFVESAVDANGLDVSSNIKADLSELDTSTPGTYNVKLTVTDWAGNTAEVTAAVTVQ